MQHQIYSVYFVFLWTIIMIKISLKKQFLFHSNEKQMMGNLH